MAAVKQEVDDVVAVGEEVNLSQTAAALRCFLAGAPLEAFGVPGGARAKEEEGEAGATEEIEEAVEATQEADEGQALRATEDPYMPYGPRLELPVKRQEPEVPAAAGSSNTEARLVANHVAGVFTALALPPPQEKKRPRRPPEVIE